MDPRRARDPRLARADPRLQRAPSGPPASAGPPPQENYMNWSTENGTPTPDFTNQNESSGMAQENATQQQENLAPNLNAPTPYRQRPLFCIVCASNQVTFFRFSNIVGRARLTFPSKEPVHGRASRAIVSSFLTCIRDGWKPSQEKQAIESYPQEQDLPYDYLDRL